jgi:dephospho-CoA kinase
VPGHLLRVALTGGIATGKSYCLARLAQAGAPTLDADQLARRAVAIGSDAYAAIRARFGPAVLNQDGAIDRDALGRLVFADPAARRDLEAIIHPVVYRDIAAWFDGLAASGHQGPAVADLPLLFETGRAADFDVVIATRCPRSDQLERLRQRGLSVPEAEQRLSSQWSADEKAARADYVVETAGSFAETDRQVDAIWDRLSGVRPRRP